MINVEMEISALFLALKLAKQVELCRLNGKDDFTLFRSFAEIIREYENKKEKREINEQGNKYNL